MRGETWDRAVSRTPQEGGNEFSASTRSLGLPLPPAQSPETPDVAALLAWARVGSREALDELFEGFRDDLLSLIRGRLGRAFRAHLDADDVLQVTLLRAFEHITEFRGTSRRSLRAWLARIARNAIRDQVDYLKRERRDMDRTVPLDDVVQSLADEDRSPISRLIWEEEAGRLVKAIACLHDRHRLVILLRKQEELSFGEIGERLGRSPDACRMLLVRAMADLARRLDPVTFRPRLAV